MQTHQDADHSREYLEQLERRAKKVMEKGDAKMTAGAPGEKPLNEWEFKQMTVREMPRDEQDILRVSVGGVESPVAINYCTFRGDRLACIALLKRALRAMERPI